ncbi:O-antigen polysaccharide polymerase Wzy family protein [Acinetobacter radioresistens]|uniref:O-antigen polysaccharide polymerase Wzy family protein n=1 Tax=Acinetobacter radioresistens TaxID=40216 RepID=UPI0021CD37A5|nr:O-antigen polysaccharide polymerase Wzy family protein [Acinetobacter radioresistens]MCU4308169.1 O-antigen polysaccharide polymerase Wzy family protein [Acinetobacter radioresistens]
MIYEVESIKKRNCIISLVLILFIQILFIILNSVYFIFNFSDSEWSFLFIFLICFILFLRALNRASFISLYSLFFMTSLLFIGGRFIGNFLGYKESNIFELDFFIYKKSSIYEATSLFYFVVVGFLSLEIGYYLSRIFIRNKNITYDKNKDIFLKNNTYILYFIFIIIFTMIFSKMLDAISSVLSGGYLSLFQNQTEAYGFNFFNLAKILLISSCGIFLSQSNKRIRILFLILLGLYYFTDMILGGRGGFVCFLLFIVWYFYDYGLRKVNAIKLVILILIILIFLSTFFSLISLRGGASEHSSIYQSVIALIYEQGISMMVFNESRFIEDYPIIPYFQNFIAGFSFIYSKIFGVIYPYDTTFASFISYKLNPGLYDLGYGLGWSFFGDAYRYSGGNLIFYSVFIIFFSIFINFLQFNVNNGLIWKVITISLVSSILFLPRSGLNTVFPLIPYILVLYFLVQFLSKVLKK